MCSSIPKAMNNTLLNSACPTRCIMHDVHDTYVGCVTTGDVVIHLLALAGDVVIHLLALAGGCTIHGAAHDAHHSIHYYHTVLMMVLYIGHTTGCIPYTQMLCMLLHYTQYVVT